MAGKPDRATLKLNAIQALESARSSLTVGAVHAKKQLSPKHLAKEVYTNHTWWVLGGTAVFALIATKVIFSGGSKNRRDSSAKTATKRGLAGMALAGIWSLARKPLLGLAAQKLTPYALQYLSRLQSPPRQTQSNEQRIR